MNDRSCDCPVGDNCVSGVAGVEMFSCKGSTCLTVVSWQLDGGLCFFEKEWEWSGEGFCQGIGKLWGIAQEGEEDQK